MIAFGISPAKEDAETLNRWCTARFLQASATDVHVPSTIFVKCGHNCLNIYIHNGSI